MAWRCVSGIFECPIPPRISTNVVNKFEGGIAGEICGSVYGCLKQHQLRLEKPDINAIVQMSVQLSSNKIRLKCHKASGTDSGFSSVTAPAMAAFWAGVSSRNTRNKKSSCADR
ncbi:hypothetical protein LAX5112_04890 [Roseibium alexandrii]|uniref:Uncharacterized protein n=1 Tax=Roseibium alexandrii TaxID=388408 RepID=A0A0M7ASF3_9HYPH|nr:hypothetical protein LAX5112_04890 [Roseibium alexandrii]